MSESIDFVLPKQGFIYSEEKPSMVLCKPKLLPLKSISLQKLEQMQKEAEKKARFQTELMARHILESESELPDWSAKEENDNSQDI